MSPAVKNVAAIILTISVPIGCDFRSRDPERKDVASIDASIAKIAAAPNVGALVELSKIASYSKNPSRFVRVHVAESLGKLAEADPDAFAESAVPSLIELLGDSELSVRSSAAKGLGRCGHFAKPAVNGLSENIMSHPSHDLAWNAAIALGEIEQASAPAITALEFAVSYRGPEGPFRYELCQCAASALGNLGTSASNALPALKKQRDSIGDPTCRATLDAAIHRIEMGQN